MRYRHLFGPVPSRRLGVSLGIDLVPLKTCTLNCIYCECGATTDLTLTRKEYAPTEEVLGELDQYLENKPYLDYITFSGSGEPTLHTGIGKIISHLKNNHPQYEICLLTNGTIFNEKEVRNQVLNADLIIPSLDAATENCFQEINRPHSNLKCTEIIQGLAKLHNEYSGETRLEVFIVPDINDTEEELTALKEAIGIIQPDCIQLGTLDRPGTEECLEPADNSKMQEISRYINQAELIGKFKPGQKFPSYDECRGEQIMQLLSRRPCTVTDLRVSLNLRPAEIQKYINHLLARDKIEVDKQKLGIFLKIK